ncbi:hypothetical protein HAZT_HAZT011199 [Hyalella azteca]|uniref:EEF1A lysine methyltransferase 1 n=1 Tax=Hyalella azteca TaxID=294128 RepID=A0A6A0GRP0_HYAAZ|nr:EEF1A lysine methyltransferase 1 [Hyalella azteca]KAA0185763.1 hypothetical protein HAZT_HAZT011199 [Hyalella azteca]
MFLCLQNLSQFWYRQDTAECLATECQRLASSCEEGCGSIACISSPTVYRTLRKLNPKIKMSVFEFDSRFAVYGEDFVLYDYRSPLSVPSHLRESFDVIIADPPYLAEDCLTKVALTIKMLSKPDAKIILCTGKVMTELAARLMGLELQKFEIRHDKERLSNPFGCFSNYDLDEYCKYTC